MAPPTATETETTLSTAPKISASLEQSKYKVRGGRSTRLADVRSLARTMYGSALVILGSSEQSHTVKREGYKCVAGLVAAR